MAAIRAAGGEGCYRLVHDTFHHHLAGETAFFPEWTGLVHISGVTDPALATRWPFALCGSALLYSSAPTQPSALPRRTWRIFDTQTLRVSDPFPSHAVEWVQVTPDCTFVATLAPAVHRVVLRLPDGSLRERALPDRAIDTAFRSSTSGVAVGERVADTFSTEDGGATWQPVETRHTGIPDDFRYRLIDLGVLDASLPLEQQAHGESRVGVPAAIESFASDGQTRWAGHTSPMGWTMRGGELFVESAAEPGFVPFRLCRYQDVPMCVTTYSASGPFGGELVEGAFNLENCGAGGGPLEARRDVEADRIALSRAERTLRSWRVAEDEIVAIRKEVF